MGTVADVFRLFEIYNVQPIFGYYSFYLVYFCGIRCTKGLAVSPNGVIFGGSEIMVREKFHPFHASITLQIFTHFPDIILAGVHFFDQRDSNYRVRIQF